MLRSMRMEQRKESWLQRQRPNGGKKQCAGLNSRANKKELVVSLGFLFFFSSLWGLNSRANKKELVFFWISLLLLLLTLWFLALSLPFFSVLCKNVRWMTAIWLLWRRKIRGNWHHEKTRRTVYQIKNTRTGSGFLVFHYTKSNFRKKYSKVYSGEKFEVRMS